MHSEDFNLKILKTSDDESLFAWWESKTDARQQTGLLAASAQDFKDSAKTLPQDFV